MEYTLTERVEGLEQEAASFQYGFLLLFSMILLFSGSGLHKLLCLERKKNQYKNIRHVLRFFFF